MRSEPKKDQVSPNTEERRAERQSDEVAAALGSGDRSTVGAMSDDRHRGLGGDEGERGEVQTQGALGSDAAGRRERPPSKEPLWIHSAQAFVFFSVFVLIQVVVLGFSVDLSLSRASSGEPEGIAETALLLVEVLCTGVFAIECILRLQASDCDWSWTLLFDGALVVIAAVDIMLTLADVNSLMMDLVGVLRISRLLRLLRITRLLTFFPELRLLVSSLLETFVVAGWAFVLLAVLCYAGALMCFSILGRSENPEVHEYFPSVPRSILSHFQLAMVEAWPDIAAPMLQENSLWGFYVVGFVAVARFGLLTVVTGVVCERVLSQARRLPPPTYEERKHTARAIRLRLDALWYGVNGDGSGKLNAEECASLCRLPELRGVLHDLRIVAPLLEEDLLALLNSNEDELLTLEDFVDVLFRLRGTSSDNFSSGLQIDFIHCSRQLAERVEEFERRVRTNLHDTIFDTGARLLKQVKRVSATAALHAAETQRPQSEEEPFTVNHAEQQQAMDELEAALNALQATVAHATRGQQSEVQLGASAWQPRQSTGTVTDPLKLDADEVHQYLRAHGHAESTTLDEETPTTLNTRRRSLDSLRRPDVMFGNGDALMTLSRRRRCLDGLFGSTLPDAPEEEAPLLSSQPCRTGRGEFLARLARGELDKRDILRLKRLPYRETETDTSARWTWPQSAEDLAESAVTREQRILLDDSLDTDATSQLTPRSWEVLELPKIPCAGFSATFPTACPAGPASNPLAVVAETAPFLGHGPSIQSVKSPFGGMRSRSRDQFSSSCFESQSTRPKRNLLQGVRREAARRGLVAASRSPRLAE